MFKCLTTHYTFNRTLCSSSRSLITISTLCNFPSKNKTQFLPIIPSTQKIPYISFPKILFVRMASGEQKFPPQKQDTQPGKEHVMDPLPQFTCPDYKPSNKLQVYIHHFESPYLQNVKIILNLKDFFFHLRILYLLLIILSIKIIIYLIYYYMTRFIDLF